jgi:AraC-like DNA-binding protein
MLFIDIVSFAKGTPLLMVLFYQVTMGLSLATIAILLAVLRYYLLKCQKLAHGLKQLQINEALLKDQAIKGLIRASDLPAIALTPLAPSAQIPLQNPNPIIIPNTGADDYQVKRYATTELALSNTHLAESRRMLQAHIKKQVAFTSAQPSLPNLNKNLVLQATQIIEQHIPDATFGVEALSKEVGMSRTQLFRKLKAYTNQSPSDYIKYTRLQKAAELIRQDAGTIAEIAFMVGFHDPSYFTKCFQKYYQKTPSEFRACQTHKQRELPAE